MAPKFGIVFEMILYGQSSYDPVRPNSATNRESANTRLLPYQLRQQHIAERCHNLEYEPL